MGTKLSASVYNFPGFEQKLLGLHVQLKYRNRYSSLFEIDATLSTTLFSRKSNASINLYFVPDRKEKQPLRHNVNEIHPTQHHPTEAPNLAQLIATSFKLTIVD